MGGKRLDRMAEHTIIETPEDLEALTRRLAKERVIAIDTEADSFFHYHDKICLLQIGFRGGIYLVDPLSLPEGGLEPIRGILADPGIRKVLHAADYDLYVMRRYAGFEIKNLFDTMISAQLLGYPAVGLAALVEHHFGVKMSKDQQRTDWSKRPLKPAQVDYAASDVEFLIELSQKLEKELRAKKRLGWAQAEFRSLEEKIWPEREFDKSGYLRIKGAKQLAPPNLAVLRELFLMRDKRAREQDRPAFKVMGNGTMLALAKHPPGSKHALDGRKGITDLVRRRLGAEILEAVKHGLDNPDNGEREKRRRGPGRRRLDRRAELRLACLKKWRAERSTELTLDPGVFCPNATLEEIAWANPKDAAALQELSLVKGWWGEQFGPEVVDTLVAEAKEPGKSGSERSSSSGSGSRRSGRK